MLPSHLFTKLILQLRFLSTFRPCFMVFFTRELTILKINFNFLMQASSYVSNNPDKGSEGGWGKGRGSLLLGGGGRGRRRGWWQQLPSWHFSPMLTTCHGHSLARRDDAKELLLHNQTMSPYMKCWWWWRAGEVDDGRPHQTHGDQVQVDCSQPPDVIAQHCRSWEDGDEIM